MFGLPSIPAGMLLRPQTLAVGAALAFVLYVYLIAIPSAERRGEAAALRAATERAAELLEKSIEDRNELSSMPAADLCRELIPDGMPDDACD